MNLVATSSFLVLFFVGVFHTAMAGCDNRDKPCQDGHGECTNAVLTALSGNLNGAIDALSYGKYCGLSNQCYTNYINGDTQGNGDLGLGARGPPPCDDIDSTCKQHDACLDRVVQEKGLGNIPVNDPDRCVCNSNYVASLFYQFKPQQPTMLCDEEYYTNPVTLPNGQTTTLANFLVHETVLMATPFCCMLQACSEGGPAFVDANTFCGAIFSMLAPLNICQL